MYQTTTISYRYLLQVLLWWQNINQKLMVCYLSQFLQQYSYYQFYNFKHLEQMINLTHQSLQIKLIPHKNKLMSSPLFNRKVPILLLTRVLPQRNSVIEWIYHAQKVLAFSKSTLFLAIATLDKLLISGMQLTETSNQLIAGSLTLLVTKFNEVYPVTIKKLQKLANNYFSLEKYIETQSMFLEILDFNLTPEDPIYQNLAELEYKLGESSEEIIKKAVSNPAVAFKLGGTALILAIESINNGGLMELKNGSRLARESVQLRNQLQRLSSHSPGIKIIVSPQRA